MDDMIKTELRWQYETFNRGS